MSSGAHVTRNIFDCVKTLLDSGAKNEEIQKFLKVSRTTVCRIKRCESYEDYKQLQAAYMLSIRKREQEKKEKAEQEKQEQAKQELPAEAPAPVDKPEPPQEKPQDKTSVNYQALHLSRMVDAQNAKLAKIIEIMQKQSELLTTISAKIAFVVDELTK